MLPNVYNLGKFMINKIYNLILRNYPFLTLEERKEFKEKALDVLKKNLGGFKKINKAKKIISLLHNKHTDITLMKNTIKNIDISLFQPSFSIQNNILFLSIPSWSKNLKGVDEELISICVANQDKYSKVIIDVRNNQGGSSTPAHNFAGIFFKEDVVFGKTFANIKEVG